MATKPTYDELDRRVSERTAELQEMNEKLKREIEERKRTEGALREQKDFLNALLETISNPVFYKDAFGKYTGCNRAFEDFIGMSRSDIVGKTVYDMAPKEIADKYHEKDLELFETPGRQRYEWKVRRFDGVLRDVIFEKATLKDTGDNVSGLVGVILDITERKRSEQALQESEETLKAILAASPVGICLAHNRILSWTNQAMYRIWGYEESSLLGESTEILYPDADEFERVGHEFYSEIEKKGIGQIETRWITKDNREIYCYLQGCPLDPSDLSKGIIVVAMDITQRKQAEEKYEDLYENAPTMHLSLDTNGIIIECNYTILNKLGYAREEFIGKSLSEFLTKESVVNMKKDFPELMKKGKILGVDRQLVAKGGEVFDVILSVTMEYDAHGKPIKTRATFEDISERKRAEDLVHNLSQMLMQSQEHERKMISYELHDSIAQNLSSLKINSDTFFDNQPEISGNLKEKMAKHSKLIDQTIQTVRDLSYDLRPPCLDEIGIVQTISQYCEEFSEKTGLRVDFTPAGMDGLKPDHNIEINLYRLVQEGLNNVWKHADAGHVAVKLIATHPNIILRIEDDGKGFDVQAREEALDSEKRMGLRSMRERVNLLQGKMTIQSRPMQSTKVLIHFPFNRGKK